MRESTNPNPDRYPLWTELEDWRPLTAEEKRREWFSLFMDQVFQRKNDLKLWQDGDGRVWLGWFRRDHDERQWIVIRVLVQTQTGTLVAVPLRRKSTDVAWWWPWMGCEVWDKVVQPYRLVVPPGVF